METRNLTIPELMLIAGTRVALGAGLALLVGERLNRKTKNARQKKKGPLTRAFQFA